MATIAEKLLLSEPADLAASATIPIVDLASFLDGDDYDVKDAKDGSAAAAKNAERLIAAKQLVNSCRHVGFVYIVNHGVPAELVDETFGWARRLFALPHDDKMKAPHPDGFAVHRGYSHPGLEKVSQAPLDDEGGPTDAAKHAELRQVRDCKESYEIGSEANADQPNVWLPEAVLPGFRAFCSGVFYPACHSAALRILRALALGLGLSDADAEQRLLQLHTGVNNQLRLLHYPALAAAELESGAAARMPAHSDWSSFTLLFQDSIGGLEVEIPSKPGTFVAVPPLANSLVMNVGDLLMRWSNGRAPAYTVCSDFLTSTLHRVTQPPPSPDEVTTITDAKGENKMLPGRYSIPYFVAPDPDLVIECLPTCVDAAAGRPARYAPTTWRQYAHMRAAYHYESKDD